MPTSREPSVRRISRARFCKKGSDLAFRSFTFFMEKKKFVILLSGPACSGKSTVDVELAKRIPGAYLVAYDKLKWQLSGFDRTKDRGLIQELLTGFFEVVCKSGTPIFLCAYMHSPEEYEHFTSVAEQNGYTFLPSELTAPTEVLVKRFHERLERVAKGEGRMTVTDEATFRENIAMRAYLPEGVPQFDTSVMAPEEIADAIMRVVNNL